MLGVGRSFEDGEEGGVEFRGCVAGLVGISCEWSGVWVQEIPILYLTVPYLHSYDKDTKTAQTGERQLLPKPEIALSRHFEKVFKDRCVLVRGI